MDYEKLIEQLRSEAETFRPDSFAQTMLLDAATALSMLQDENERLKNKLSELAHLQFDEPGIGERTRLMAENESLRAEVEHWKNAHHQAALNFQQENRECNKVLAELEQVKREKDALIGDFVDYVTDGVPNPAIFCRNRCDKCTDMRGWCTGKNCSGFYPSGARGQKED